MTDDRPTYSDADVRAAIDSLRLENGAPLSPEQFARLTPRQRAWYRDALVQQEFDLLLAWHRDWEAGRVSDPPPCGRWAWCHFPDDLSGLDGLQ